ncbi:aspartyl/glutamyl-tRNA(Asn/Gln) amidotransferase, C subunit [Peptoniphilus sp. oral taxon 375 str. F0436]|uniref:Asp-tRNA(Asn)/Glu-tRNA(Gln) amidotransferase subunit GatC n=1 Tax=Urinicoccus timonensis TaxID=2024205 RepID=UPI00021A2DF4|nr:Asp-tRNA(Asn)/Glu-tRNA(Gln) amidotransferase subunit GatC [Urinicoccus timonensis]EGS30252.1 aspartyl/glutamyl-tRNA(Asn/Gln) amidotransferase, C subunit [Peptoniphilus sp. oral taxon 375 str. F0436]
MKRDQIKHIANIAKLDFSEEELAKFADSFSETMDFVDQIRQVATEDTETFQVNEMGSHLREDQVKEGLNQDQATRNSESEKYGYFDIIRYVD